MPLVTSPPKGLQNGNIITEFTDTTNLSAVTYTYPTQQTSLVIENSGEKDIFVTVGSYTDQLIQADKKWKVDTPFTSFSIKSNVNSQEFIATASFDSEEDLASLTAQLAEKANKKEMINTNGFFTVSDYKNELMSHGSQISIDTDGTVYMVYMADPTHTVETPENTTTIAKLAVFNLINPRDIVFYTFAQSNVTDGGITSGSRPPYDQAIMLKGSDSAYCYTNLQIGGVITYVVRPFDKVAKTFGNFQVLKFVYDTVEYDFNLTNVQNIYNTATGSSLSLRDLKFNTKIVWVNSESCWYSYISGYQVSGSGFCGIIVKSTDGIKWTVVAIPTAFNTQITEAEILVGSNYVYIVGRDDSAGIYKLRYNKLNGTFGTRTLISNSIAAKPQMFEFNGANYIMYNVNEPLTSEWGTVTRNKLAIAAIDINMNETFIQYLKCETGLHYYSVENYHGTLFMAFSTDTRKLNISQVRSNIGFTELNLEDKALPNGFAETLLLSLDGADFPTSQGAWVDHSSFGNSATPVNFGFTTSSGSDGAGGVKFDGINDICTIPAKLMPPSGDFTVLIKFKHNVTGTEGYIFGQNNAGNDGRTGISIVASNQFVLTSKNALGNISLVHPTTLINGATYVAAIVRSNQKYTSYVSNVASAEVDATGKNIYQANTKIGAFGDTNSLPFAGTIYKILSYNKALSTAELTEQYNLLNG